MNRIMRALGLCFAVFCMGASQASKPVPSPAPTSTPSTAASLVIYFMPEDVLTNIAVDPQSLQQSHNGMVSYSDEPVASQLWQVAKADVVGPTRAYSDVRWGVRIFDDSGNLVGEYYVDAWGTTGYANGQRVKFRGALHNWLKSHLLLFERFLDSSS